MENSLIYRKDDHLPHKLGLSGSTILSNPEQFHELFLEELDHIEIGEFPDEDAFKLFIQHLKSAQRSFGIHSPLMRKNSKYDLIEYVHIEPEKAWYQIEEEAMRLTSLGAEYVLVHFPYFKTDRNGVVHQEIEQGLQRLSQLQDKYDIPLVCEPKLGQNRNPCGIHYLDDFSVERWEHYGLPLCFDLGDYLLADADHIFDHIHKWQDYIKVVHLHNVSYQNGDANKYIWSPVHPSQEDDPDFYSLKPIIQKLAQGSDVRFLFEHTPHHVPSKQYVREGIEWVRTLIK